MRKLIGCFLLSIGVILISVSGCILWIDHTGQKQAIHQAEAAVKSNHPQDKDIKERPFHPRKGQVLLSGHRDTVFRHLGDLKPGDKIIVQMPYGTFQYSMKGWKIVSEDDTTVIHSTAPKEVLTLSTCYPFHYIGHAPKRYIITAYPLK
ncbi:sortase A [Scopulibacillus daqui]|uniref:Sortase A n=1 Tax=Scopulibacillus daqui TaxID=1469162 RepID=A0ABS2PWX9_9BACL|nr:sortase [Scopulibacillus daqui]MBM7644559.1 sortase A [Scopulibacillus daqui]